MHGLNASNTGTGDLEIAFNNNTINTVGANGVNIVEGGTGRTFVTGFEGNTFAGDGGTTGVQGSGVVMTGVTFDADTADGQGDFDSVNAGATAIGASVTPVGAAGMVLASVAGDVDFGMSAGVLDIFATTTGLMAGGTGVFVMSPGSGFRITVPNGSVINSSTGVAIDLDPLVALFGTSGGSQVTLAGQSASLDQVDGSLFFSSSSALTVAMNGASGSVDFNGTVDLGTTIPISDGSGGFEMTGNNATFAVHFSDLDIVTNASNLATPGIVGTAGGMLDIDTGTVTTTGESAVDIDGIGFGTTVTFSSVTSNGTGMGDPGIDLSNVTGTFNGGIAAIGTTTPNNAIGIRVTGSSAAIGFTTVNIVNASGDGIDINGSSGSFDVTGNTTIDVGSSTGIDVLGSTTDIGFGGALSITNAGTAINIDGTGGTPADFDVVGAANLGVNATNGVTTGINIQDMTGSSTFTFATVNIGTNSGSATTGLSFMNNTGAPTVNFGTALNVTNSGGPGIFAMSAGMITSAAGSSTPRTERASTPPARPSPPPSRWSRAAAEASSEGSTSKTSPAP